MAYTRKLFWDSCVLNAHLYDEQDKYDVASIRQFLEEALDDRLYEIYVSTVSLAETSTKKLKGKRLMLEFFADYAGHLHTVEPSPNVMIMAGQLRDLRFKKADIQGDRVLSVPDAIMLASCLYLEDAFGISVDVFHTFDDSKRQQKMPLLSLNEYCEHFTGEDAELAQRLCSLKRERPIHPTPNLPLKLSGRPLPVS